MAQLSVLKTYTCFMRWFHQQHPELYHKYWQNITAPAPDGNLNIDAAGLEPLELVRLMQVQFDYYNLQE